MASPLLNSNELLKKIELVADFDSDQKQPNSLAVRRLRSEIEKIRAHDASSSYMLDGILDAQLGDIDRAKSNHEKALALEPSDYANNWNYSATLTKFSRFHEAYPIARRMLDIGHVTNDTFSSVAWLATVSLNIEGLSWSLDRFDKLTLAHSDSNNLVKLMANALNLNSLLLKHTDREPELLADLERVYGHVQAVLESSLMGVDIVNAAEDNFYGQSVLHLNYVLKTSDSENCIAMNETLLERIVADEELIHWDRLIASFVPSNDDANEQGAEVYAGNA